MVDGEDDDAVRRADGDGDDDRPDRPQDTHHPGPADHFWVGVLVVIVVILVLIGILSNVDMNNGGDPSQDWDTVWH
ncbi:hypothetical protein [Streptomyces sp. NPDC055055]